MRHALSSTLCHIPVRPDLVRIGENVFPVARQNAMNWIRICHSANENLPDYTVAFIGIRCILPRVTKTQVPIVRWKCSIYRSVPFRFVWFSVTLLVDGLKSIDNVFPLPMKWQMPNTSLRNCRMWMRMRAQFLQCARLWLLYRLYSTFATAVMLCYNDFRCASMHRHERWTYLYHTKMPEIVSPLRARQLKNRMKSNKLHKTFVCAYETYYMLLACDVAVSVDVSLATANTFQHSQ